MLITSLLKYRLIHYRKTTFERLWRFKIWIFFMLSMIVPTVSVAIQILDFFSKSLFGNASGKGHPVALLIFQFTVILWMGSQKVCLNIQEIEHYYRTLNIHRGVLFFVEIIFILILLFPFLVCIGIGAGPLNNNPLFLFHVAQSFYFITTLIFISICLIFNKPFYILLLGLTNAVGINFPYAISFIVSGGLLLTLSYVLSTKPHLFSYSSLDRLFLSKKGLALVFKYFPLLGLNLKCLLLQHTLPLLCVFSINVLFMVGGLTYASTSPPASHLGMVVLIVFNSIMYVTALLSYKLTETRQSYGQYFLPYYKEYYFIGVESLTLYLLGTVFFIVPFCVLSLSLKLGFFFLWMIKVISLSSSFFLLCFFLNRRFLFYGPLLTLLSLIGLLLLCGAHLEWN